MSERGYFFMDRGVWDHPLFAHEKFTQREAWLWMISTAVWKATKVRAGRKIVQLARGQLIFSERFLAEKWRWAKTTVRRFIARLESEAMVSVLADRDATLITICNYDKYQLGGTTDGPLTGPQSGPLTDHSRTKEEETNTLRKEDIIGNARASNFTEGSKKLSDAFWKALGFESPLQIPPEYAGVDWRAIGWEIAGWTVDLIDAEARRIGPAKPLSYYEKVFATAFAKRQAPLPVVEIRDAEKLTVKVNGTAQTHSVTAAARRFAEQFESQSSIGIESNSDALLRLSQG